MKKCLLTGAVMCAMLCWSSAYAFPHYQEAEGAPGNNDSSATAETPTGPPVEVEDGLGLNKISGKIGARSETSGAPSDDVDFYRIILAQAGSLDLEITNTTTLDSYLSFYDSFGTLLATNNDAAGFNSRIGVLTGLSSGDYFAAVSSAINIPLPVFGGTNVVGSSTVLAPPNSGTVYSAAPIGNDTFLGAFGATSGSYDLEITFEALVAAIGSITGVKFEDLNGNGTQDIGEDFLDGWTIQLFDDLGNLLSQTVTAGGGLYSFLDIDVGSYVINEVMQTGWTQTAGGGSITVSDSQITEMNFGNKETVVGVPEPTALALMGLGLAGIGFGRRYKKARA